MATTDIGIRIGLQGAQGVEAGLQRVQAGLGNLGTRVDTVSNALKSLAPTLAGVFSVGALVSFVKTTVDGIDAMNDLADATGASIEAISKLDQVASRSGSSLDQVSSLLIKFNGVLKDADGKNGASIALNAIGLEAEKLRQLDPAEALRQTAVALEGFADNADKARIVQELFGKSVGNAAPLLKDLAEAGAAVNATINADQAAEVDKFNKALAGLSANVTDAARSLVLELLPALTQTLTKFNAFSQNGGVLSGFGDLLVSQFKDARVAATLEEIERLQARLQNPNVTGFNRATVQRDLDNTKKLLIDVQGEAGKAKAALDKALGRSAASAGSAAPAAPKASAPDIAAEQARIKAAELSAAALQKQSQAYDTLRNSISERVAAGQAELQQASPLSESQKLQTKLNADYAAGLVKLTPAQKVVLDARLEDLGAIEQQVQAEKDATKAATEAAKARSDFRREEERAIQDYQERQAAATAASLAGVNQRIDDLKAEAAAAELAAGLNISLAEAIELVTLNRLSEKQAQYTEGSEPYLAVEREIQARRELAGLIASKENASANAKAAKDAADDWKKASDQINQSLTDALMRAFESGKGFFDTLWQSIKNTLKTTVLRAIIQPVVGGVTGAFSLNASAEGMGGGGGSGFESTLGAIKGIKGIYDTISSGFTALGDSVAFAAQDVGAYLVNNTSGILNQAGSSLMNGANALGAAASYLGGAAVGVFAGRAISNGYSLNGGSGNSTVNIGTAIGAIVGGPIGAAIGGAIGGAVNRLFGKGPERIKSQGITGNFTGSTLVGGESYVDKMRKGGTFRSDDNWTERAALDAETQKLFSQTFATLKLVTAGFAADLGLPVQKIANYSKQLNLVLTQDAEKNKEIVANFFGKMSDEMAQTVIGTTRMVTTETGKLIRGTLPNGKRGFIKETVTSEVYTPSKFAKDGETAGATLARLSTSLSTVNQVFGTLGTTLLPLATLNLRGGFLGMLGFIKPGERYDFAGADAASKLIDIFGSVENFVQGTSSYYQAIYTDQERAATTVRQLGEAFTDLGLSVPSTRQAYKDLVNSQDLMTDSGRSTYAALIALSGVFGQVTDAADEAAAQVKQNLAAIAQERSGLERQLLELQGDTAAIRALERTALDESNRALYDQITALQDSQAATEAAAQAAAEAARQQEELANAIAAAGRKVSDEIQRLRGAATGGATDEATLRAQFAITTAQARSGNLDALNALPELTAAIEASALLSAGSTIELNKIRALLAASLSDTLTARGIALPGLATGTNYVPADMIAQLHEGEAVVPRAYNPAAGAGQGAMVTELRALRSEVEGLRAEARATAVSSNKTARLLERVTLDGEAMQTVAA